ncbi:phage major capsid protein [Streptomyces sp. NPDC050560]|uniref:phage major capsid protein n=1 Tax=Streptomyces sp. NPDC050560 TaxID=3365630 RepID=UPI00379E2FE9
MPSTVLDRAIDKRARVWAQMQEIQARAESAGADGLTAEERAAWDAAEADLTAASEDIERLERAARLDTVSRAGVVVTTGPAAEDRRETPQDEETAYREAFMAFTRYGASELTAEQRALMTANRQQIRAQATSPGSAGGYTIPTETLNKITETMKAFGGILGAANVMPTASGAPINWPTNDDTANVGAILAENSQVTEQDVEFGQKELGAYTYTSKMVRISLQLLQDSAFPLDSWLPTKLGERIGRAVAAHLATGTGTNQPTGLFTAATTGVTGAEGQADSVTYEDLVDLQHSVDIAYRNGGQYVMADQTLKAVRKLVDGMSRPLWEPSLQAGVPSTLLGFPVLIDNGVSAMAAEAKSIGFGDVNAAYVVRQVAGGQMMRLAERYADFLQVGFLGFARFDAVLDDGAAFRVYANAES